MMAVMLDHLCSTAKAKNFPLKKVFFFCEKKTERKSVHWESNDSHKDLLL